MLFCKHNFLLYTGRFMHDYEFIKYQELPDDPYTKALITIRQNLYDKSGNLKAQLLTFGAKDLKTGARFYAMANHGVTIDGEKKYIKGHRCDSIGDQEMLEAFVAECARARGNPHQPASVFKPQSMDEVAESQGLPF